MDLTGNQSRSRGMMLESPPSQPPGVLWNGCVHFIATRTYSGIEGQREPPGNSTTPGQSPISSPPVFTPSSFPTAFCLSLELIAWNAAPQSESGVRERYPCKHRLPRIYRCCIAWRETLRKLYIFGVSFTSPVLDSYLELLYQSLDVFGSLI